MNSWIRYRFGLSEQINPWTWLARVAWLRTSRPWCVIARHTRWQRESMLMALHSGRSKRCPRCNRLVLRKEFR